MTLGSGQNRRWVRVVILGVGLTLVAVFVGFGLLIGILFGFFGMGGSFLVTSALLVFSYPAKVAVGSGLGARIGAAATDLVDEAEITGYFAAMLLAGSLAVASKTVSEAYDMALLNTVSIVLVFGAATLVSSAIVYSALKQLRENSAEYGNLLG